MPQYVHVPEVPDTVRGPCGFGFVQVPVHAYGSPGYAGCTRVDTALVCGPTDTSYFEGKASR